MTDELTTMAKAEQRLSEEVPLDILRMQEIFLGIQYAIDGDLHAAQRMFLKKENDDKTQGGTR